MNYDKHTRNMKRRIEKLLLREAEKCDRVYPGKANPTAIANRNGAKICRALAELVESVIIDSEPLPLHRCGCSFVKRKTAE